MSPARSSSNILSVPPFVIMVKQYLDFCRDTLKDLGQSLRRCEKYRRIYCERGCKGLCPSNGNHSTSSRHQDTRAGLSYPSIRSTSPSLMLIPGCNLTWGTSASFSQETTMRSIRRTVFMRPLEPRFTRGVECLCYLNNCVAGLNGVSDGFRTRDLRIHNPAL